MSESSERTVVTRRDVSGVAAPIGRYSHVVVAAPGVAIAYISGQIGADAQGRLAGPGAREQGPDLPCRGGRQVAPPRGINRRPSARPGAGAERDELRRSFADALADLLPS
jgi:hypothetical protein